MSCKFISIDSSSKKTGYAVWENGNYIRSELLDLSNEKDANKRLGNMMKTICEILSKEQPDIVYVEEMNVTRNAQTSRLLLRLQGAIQYWCVENNNVWFETVQASRWRKYVRLEPKGRKREDYKAAAIEYVKQHYGIQVNDDEAEAICIGEAMLTAYA